MLCNCPSKKDLNFHFGFNNSKLRKNKIVAFDLPAYKDENGRLVCPNAGECAVECYARQFMYMYPAPKKAHQHNFDFLRADKKNQFSNFMKYMRHDLKIISKKYENIRVHSGGDFFHIGYFLSWLQLANEFSHLNLYAYTKMISFVLEYQHIIPPNFKIIQSFGGKQDKKINTSLPHSVVFNNLEDLKSAGYMNTSDNDSNALHGETKIGLVRHGSRVSIKKRSSWESTTKLFPVI